MAKGFEVKINVAGVTALADKLGRVDDQALGRASVAAVNLVADRTYETARARMTAGINLSDTYLQDRMSVSHAKDPSNARAVIGARYRHTRLSTFDAKQLTVAAPKAVGSPRRGISAGQKAAGVSVQVTKGAPKAMPGAILIPLTDGNGTGVFLRTKSGKGVKKGASLKEQGLKHRYGPSVYQLFRVAVDDIYDDVEADLQAALQAEALREIEGIL